MEAFTGSLDAFEQTHCGVYHAGCPFGVCYRPVMIQGVCRGGKRRRRSQGVLSGLVVPIRAHEVEGDELWQDQRDPTNPPLS
jgi:hypothetical protein